MSEEYIQEAKQYKTLFAVYNSDDMDPDYISFKAAFDAAVEYLEIVQGTNAQAWIIEYNNSCVQFTDGKEEIINVWQIDDNETNSSSHHNTYKWKTMSDIYKTHI